MANDSGSVLLALLVGAAIGAGVGILYAPDEGSKTRQRIKDKAQEASDDLVHRVNSARDELTRSAADQKAEFDKKLEETISKMSYKADDIIAGLEKKLEELRKKNAQLQK
ncbi:MAG: YtxH domain-containing protein [Robiginitalea sp.]|nr:YtxH domain-containing protein [Robiginitalea sp.]